MTDLDQKIRNRALHSLVSQDVFEDEKTSHLLKCNNIIYFSTVHECFAPVNALRIMGTVMTRHIRIFFFFKIKSGQFLPLLASQVIKLNFS